MNGPRVLRNRGPNRRPTLKAVVAVLTTLMIASQSFAQAGASTTAGAEPKGLGGPRRQIATIMFAGLGGAILGLSTLSFYGRPQDKLNNIAIGAAVGVMAGTVMVTYKAATNPAELYGTRPLIERELELSRDELAPRGPFVFNFEF